LPAREGSRSRFIGVRSSAFVIRVSGFVPSPRCVTRQVRADMRNQIDSGKALLAAISAAQAVGKLMRRHLNSTKRANEVTQHDIKLELDVRSQKLIERTLRSTFPGVPLLG